MSDVTCYRLNPEQLARYGPVTPPAKAAAIRRLHALSRLTRAADEQAHMTMLDPEKKQTGRHKPRPRKPVLPVPDITREQYEEHKAAGKTDDEVAAVYGRTRGKWLTALKRQWGLMG